MTGATTLQPLAERSVAGMRLYAGGAGRPVVLLHGLGGAAANWGEVAADLAGSYRVLAPDLPGHGGSEVPDPGADMDWFADAVATLLDTEGARGAIVVGHSFGGQLALRLALRRPELVGSLLLVAPAGIRTRARLVQVAIAASTFVRPGRVVARARGRYA